MQWKQYRRKATSEMRPYVPGEDLTGVSVSAHDQPPQEGGMIARNAENPTDQWYVSRAWFNEHYEEVEGDAS